MQLEHVGNYGLLPKNAWDWFEQYNNKGLSNEEFPPLSFSLRIHSSPVFSIFLLGKLHASGKYSMQTFSQSYSNSFLFYPSKFMSKAEQLVLGPCVSNAPLSAISDLTCFKHMSNPVSRRERFSVAPIQLSKNPMILNSGKEHPREPSG